MKYTPAGAATFGKVTSNKNDTFRKKNKTVINLKVSLIFKNLLGRVIFTYLQSYRSNRFIPNNK